MAKKKFYAVKVGLTPGIYETWAECEANVKGYPKADYKGFTTLAEAQHYMNEDGIEYLNDLYDLEAAGWTQEDKKEISSVYKAMGIRAGVSIKF